MLADLVHGGGCVAEGSASVNNPLARLSKAVLSGQQQSDIIAMKYPYRIDGFTKIIIRNILANATVKLYFYPADNINLARGLAGRPVSKQFGNPGIVRNQTVVLK
jgi:hypothetical protein